MLTALLLTLVPGVPSAPLPATARIVPATAATACSAHADLDAELRRLEAGLVPQLEELAEEAQKARAFHFRNDVYRLVLELEPDHEKARKFLGYKWDRKAEAWVLPREPRPAKDAKEDALPPLRDRRDAILGGHRDAVLALLDAEAELPLRRRNQVLAGLLERMPDDEVLNRRLGHERADGTWWLVETLVARRTRAERKESLRGLRDALGEPTISPLSGWEDELGSAWKSAAELDGVRVVGNVGDRELSKVAQAVHLARDHVGHCFDQEVDWDIQRYLMEDTGSKGKLLDGLGLDPETKERMMSSSGAMLNHRLGLTGANSEDARKDCAVRHMCNGYMAALHGVTPRIGWANEGFGMYLTHQVVGTRMTYFIRDTQYTRGGGGVARDMADSDWNWLELAHRVLADREDRYNLAFGLGRDVNNMTREDLLVGYALAAYLLEGHPTGVAGRVLTGLGRDERSSVEVLEEVLGYDPYTLASRLERWLEETGR